MRGVLTISAGNIDVPVKIVNSRGRNIRFSYKDGQGRISMPSRVDKDTYDRAIRHMQIWLENLAINKPHLFQEPPTSVFLREALILMGEAYKLELIPHGNQSLSGYMNGHTLRFEIPHAVYNDAQVLSIQLPLLINRLFRNKVMTRVAEVNSRTIRGHISKFTLRSANSRWGSCSYNNGIMLSNRLLLAPVHILDSVIIHELAHIVHKDHSHSFWKLVAQQDPRWRENHEWLNKNGHTLRY